MRYLMPGAMRIALSSVLTSCAAKAGRGAGYRRTGVSTQSIQVAGGATAARTWPIGRGTEACWTSTRRAFAALEGAYAALGIAITRTRDNRHQAPRQSSFSSGRKDRRPLMTRSFGRCGGDGGHAQRRDLHRDADGDVASLDDGRRRLPAPDRCHRGRHAPLTNAANDVQCSSGRELRGGIEQRVRAQK